MNEGFLKRLMGRIAGLFKFSRMDLAVPPFMFAGLGAAFISAMGCMVLGYDSRPKDIHAVISLASELLFFPAFLIALLRRRWASLPLWLCSLAVLGPVFMRPKGLFAESSFKAELELLGVVLLTEAARLIRGDRPEKPE